MKACWIVGLALALWAAAGCRPSVPTPGPGTPDGASSPEAPSEVAPTQTPIPEATPSRTPKVEALPAAAQKLVDLAQADLALKLERKAAGIAVLSVERADFRDASLGVPEPGKMYAQVITPGYVIRLSVGDKVYTYHGSGERVVAVPEEQP